MFSFLDLIHFETQNSETFFRTSQILNYVGFERASVPVVLTSIAKRSGSMSDLADIDSFACSSWYHSKIGIARYDIIYSKW